MEGKKVLVVTTISNTINAFLVPHIIDQIENGNTVEIGCRITNPIANDINRRNLKVHEIAFSRNIFNRGNIHAFKQLRDIISKGKYDLIETHTPIASTLTRLAAIKEKETKVIYTAHGFHFFKNAPIIAWLLFYPIEKFLARYTNAIVTINLEDENRAKKMVNSKRTKVYRVDGIGTNISFKKLNSKEKERIKSEIGVSDKKLLICIAELSKRKNQIELLSTMKNFKDKDVVLLMVGTGPLEKDYVNFVNENNLNNTVKFLGFRIDIHDLLQISDVLVSTSKQEGLPVNIMEGMAHGIPIVASKIRGHTDLLGSYPNGDIYSANGEIEKCIESALKRDKIDFDMSKYGLDKAVQEYNKIYDQIVD